MKRNAEPGSKMPAMCYTSIRNNRAVALVCAWAANVKSWATASDGRRSHSAHYGGDGLSFFYADESQEMAWIEVHQSLLTHRKTMALAEELEIPEVHAIGHLVALWTWALDNAPDGVLPQSERIVARAAQWPSMPEQFVCALINSGFIDEGEDGRAHIHDWDDYAGRLIERRKADAERKRNVRKTSGGHPPDGARTQPNQSKPVSFDGSLCPDSSDPGIHEEPSRTGYASKKEYIAANFAGPEVVQ